MAEWENPAPGAFCWVEVATSDPKGSKKFYSSLFGWKIDDVPMEGAGEPYGMAKIGDKMVGGIATLTDDAKSMGAPPMWLSHVAVEDAQATAKKAARLGGKILFEPLNVGPGTMAIIADPAGGTLGLWQQHEAMGTFVYQEPNALCWNELMSTNVDVAGKFYTSLFGWKAELAPMPGMQYTLFKIGDKHVGGMMAMPKEAGKMPSAWAVYFEVADVDASYAKAQSLGAKPIMPLMDVPNVGRFGSLIDPQGAAFALIKSSVQPTK